MCGRRPATGPPVDWSPVSQSGRGTASRPTGTGPLTLADLAALLGAPVQGDAGTAVTGVTLASGEVGPGDLYAALPGARTHGAGG